MELLEGPGHRTDARQVSGDGEKQRSRAHILEGADGIDPHVTARNGIERERPQHRHAKRRGGGNSGRGNAGGGRVEVSLVADRIDDGHEAARQKFGTHRNPAMGRRTLPFRLRQKVADRGPESALPKRECERISAHDIAVVTQQEDDPLRGPRHPELDPKHVVFEPYLKLSNRNQRRGHDPRPPLRVTMRRISDRDDDACRT